MQKNISGYKTGIRAKEYIQPQNCDYAGEYILLQKLPQDLPITRQDDKSWIIASKIIKKLEDIGVFFTDLLDIVVQKLYNRMD